MLTIINPATEEKVRELQEDTAQSIAEKVQKAKKAQRDWAKTPLEQRLKAIAGFKAALAEKKDELAATLSGETGKPISQAKNEVNATGDRVQFFLDNVGKVLQPDVVHTAADISEQITYEPLGVIANISAWNYPYFVGTNVFIP